MIKKLILFYFLIMIQLSFCQNSNIDFINALLNNQDLSDYLDEDYDKFCHRLKTNYIDQKQKALIGLTLPLSVIEAIKSGEAYKSKEEVLDSVNTKLSFSIQKLDFKRDYYFKKGKLISAQEYYRQTMQVIETKYINFYFSDKKRFNYEGSEFLQGEIEKLLNKFHSNISKSRRALLESQKINYIICQNMDEMEQITGFRTNGIALLNDDTVVSIDPAHYHELLHILINFILEDTKTYTHPLFQEGFAVALGGRSGRSPSIMLESGAFLLKQEFIRPQDLYNTNDFYAMDASISYSVSALIIDYLLKETEAKDFLKLYQRYVVSEMDFQNLLIQDKDLRLNQAFTNYLETYTTKPRQSNITYKNIYHTDKFDIYQDINDSNNIKLSIIKGIYLSCAEANNFLYQSRIFREILASQPYKSERYLIKADENEIILYDLYLDQIQELFSNGFSDIPIIERENEQRISLYCHRSKLIAILIDSLWFISE